MDPSTVSAPMMWKMLRTSGAAAGYLAGMGKAGEDTAGLSAERMQQLSRLVAEEEVLARAARPLADAIAVEPHGEAGLQHFGILQAACRGLKLPACIWPEPQPTRDRVHPAEVEVPSVLIRLAAVENRALDDPGTVINGYRGDAERDVRGVERVMRERRHEIFG